MLMHAPAAAYRHSIQETGCDIIVAYNVVKLPELPVAEAAIRKIALFAEDIADKQVVNL